MTSLHTHSWYSLLEGANSPEALVQHSARLGNTSLALTDTNNLYGAVSFVAACRTHGIKPLLGSTLRHRGQEVVALVADASGYRSLCRILSRIHLEPSDASLTQMLCDDATGLHVLLRDPQLALPLRDAFGDRMSLEVVRPHSIQGDEKRILDEARRMDLPFVASTAAYFADADDYRIARVTTAVRDGKRIDELPASLSIGPAHRLVSRTELRWRCRDLPEAAVNAERLAEALTGDPLPSGRVLPPSMAPHGSDDRAYLRSLCERGLRKRGLADNAEADARLALELHRIGERNLAAYFLVVADIARFARRRRHPLAVRGVAGHSLVCYLLEATDIDPLRFGLSADRFLPSGGVELPQLDFEFDPKIRDQAVDFVFRRSGRERTALISSHVFFEPRSAFRESAKIHGVAAEPLNALCDALGPRIEWMLRADPHDMRLRSTPREFPMDSARWGRVLHDARRLLDRPHHLSPQPGGIVLAADRLDNHVPLQSADHGAVVTQFDKEGIATVGLVTFNLLSNRTLGAADELQGYGFKTPPLEDPATMELLRRGETLGIAQLESQAMRHALVQMRPERIEDVAAALALVRAGAASGDAPGDGEMIFEEDALQTIESLAGYSHAEADRLFDRMRASDSDEKEHALSQEWFDRTAERGIPREVAETRFGQLLKFRRHAFSKSQAVSCGLLALQTAAYKVHHPVEFWAAALNNNHGAYPRRVYIEAAKQAGLRILPPCVNRSQEGFTVEDGALRVGLEAMGPLPADVRERLLSSRRTDGRFRGIADFVNRVEPNRATLSALVRCSAFDFANEPRRDLLAEVRGGDGTLPIRPVAGSLFGDDDDDGVWTTPDAAQRAQRFDELAMLGLMLGPPMLSLFAELLPPRRVRAKELAWHAGKTATVAGMLASVRETKMSEGRLVHFVTLQDESGLIDLAIAADSLKAPSAAEAGPYQAVGVVREAMDLVTLEVQRFELCRPAPKKKTGAKSSLKQFPQIFGETLGGMPGVAS